jgi:hypothetical protein
MILGMVFGQGEASQLSTKRQEATALQCRAHNESQMPQSLISHIPSKSQP